MVDIIERICNISDQFSLTTDRTEQRQLMEAFIREAEKAIIHPECSDSYREYLISVIPRFRNDLRRISEIDLLFQ